MKIFDALMEIKRFREEQAELSVGRERRKMVEAAKACREAETALERFRERARIEEKDMYSDLCSRMVRVREIDGVLQRVAGLRHGERECDALREKAAESEAAAAHALHGARQVHQHAVRQRDKFVDLAGVYLADEIKERENREDAEIEEVASAAWRPREWDDDIEGGSGMSNDRRTGLDTGLTRNSPGWDLGYGSDQNHRNKPSEDDTNAFKRAMGEPEQATVQLPVTPFGLFGATASPLPAPDTAARQLEESVGLAAKRLLVSDQASGGPREVRLDLADEFLPDVSVSLYEEGGQLVVAFRCGTEEAQTRVSTLAPGLASDLARSLCRTVRVCLQDKDGADINPGNWEADAPGTLTLKDGLS